MPPRKTTKTKTRKKAAPPKKTAKAQKHSPWHMPLVPLSSWILFWAFVLTAIILSAACFTSGFRPTNESPVNQETSTALKTLREQLEQQLAEMDGEIMQPKAADGRVLLSMGSRIDHCPTVFSTTTADITINAQSDLDVSMSLPYSFSWGNERYAMNPYETGQGSAGEVYFGPGIVTGDCIVVRDSSIVINDDTRSANEIRREINAQDVQPKNLRERTINGIQVLSYTINRGAGDEKNWIAFGRTHRYNLHSEGWLTDAEAVKIIQSLRVTK